MTASDGTELAWVQCRCCRGYAQVWTWGGDHVDIICPSTDAWEVGDVCPRPRCGVPGCCEMADGEVGGEPVCAWCAEHPEVGRVAAE